MIKTEYHVIGCMSGTSLDGLDLAYIQFNFDKKVHFKIINAITIKYPFKWHERLQNLIAYSKDELKQIDIEYTTYIGKEINSFILQNNINHVDAICSHGHTALHQPHNGLTYQIGNLKTLAEITKNTVVCDFRTQDVELGGQGAPLVPIGDALLFEDYDFCLNLGGFANISFNNIGERLAYDICPVNIVLNHYTNQLGFDFDNEGQLAASGSVHKDLYARLNKLEFYKQRYPKSLGLEWVKTEVFPLIDSYQLEVKDILKTFVMHLVFQIANEITSKENAKVLVTGGGAYNSFLVSQLKLATKSCIIIPETDLIEYKEALIFGLLGVLKIRNEINCLASVTGARNNHSSGKIYIP
jgi:anhydro-N-acetylmuramic acid kinase